MIPDPRQQYKAERQIERLYLVKNRQNILIPGEELPNEFWEWTELEFKALKHMYSKGWNVWDMANELHKNPTATGVALALWGEEGKIHARHNQSRPL